MFFDWCLFNSLPSESQPSARSCRARLNLYNFTQTTSRDISIFATSVFLGTVAYIEMLRLLYWFIVFLCGFAQHDNPPLGYVERGYSSVTSQKQRAETSTHLRLQCIKVALLILRCFGSSIGLSSFCMATLSMTTHR